MPLSEADKWLNHLGSCSPCYRDFLQLQAAHRARRRQTLFAIAASILIVVTLVGWVVVRQQKQQPLVVQTAVLDLRNRSLSRGAESNPSEPPLEIHHAVKHLTVYLPLGSPEGPYEMRITTAGGNTVFTSSGVAFLKEGTTSLDTAVDLSSAAPGQYVFQVRRADSEWNSHGLLLR
jgi:hypothetical protein